MFRAYKFRLYPSKEQKVLLEKHFGASRWLYNKALEMKNKTYQETKKSLNRFEIQKQMVSWKKEEQTKWLSEVSAQSLQVSLLNLDKAFTNFFKKLGKYPNFKKKGDKDSFGVSQGSRADFEKEKFHFLKFQEGIKCNFSREFTGEIKSCTISKTKTGKYFVSILVDDGKAKALPLETSEEKCLGIDLGIKDFATFSDGAKVENPKFLKKKIKRLKRLSRQHSKKKKGSKNREKARIKLAKQHEKVTNCRKDFQHKLSTKIAENQSYTSVSMETLNIQGMIKNSRLAQSIADAAWFQFKTFLKYKLEERGKTLFEIGRFEPSSKMCSCGHINNQLTLKDRFWTCSACGTVHDRDVLAANNIRKFAFCEKILVGSVRPEFTPLEIPVTESLKEECFGFSN